MEKKEIDHESDSQRLGFRQNCVEIVEGAMRRISFCKSRVPLNFLTRGVAKQRPKPPTRPEALQGLEALQEATEAAARAKRLHVSLCLHVSRCVSMSRPLRVPCRVFRVSGMCASACQRFSLFRGARLAFRHPKGPEGLEGPGGARAERAADAPGPS